MSCDITGDRSAVFISVSLSARNHPHPEEKSFGRFLESLIFEIGAEQTAVMGTSLRCLQISVSRFIGRTVDSACEIHAAILRFRLYNVRLFLRNAAIPTISPR